MEYNEEYFEKFRGHKVKINFSDGFLVAEYDTFLPEKDNEYNAILVKSEGQLIEVRVEEIVSIEQCV